MSQGKPRDPRKEQQWRRWIRQWQGSGLTIRAFCERYDLSQPSFYAWRREISRRDAAISPFVPVHLVPDEQPVCASPSLFEVLLPGGATLRVPQRFDPATLRQLLAILQEGRSC
jgi:hypothetical protein